MRRVILAALLACGCATGAPARRPSDLDGALAAWAGGEGGRARSRVVRGEDPRPLTAPVRIARPQPAMRAHGRRVDVDLRGASLASALAFLADAADVGLVIGEGVEGTVDVALRRVRPLEAMRALAEAHGVELVVVGRTVVARRGGS